MKGPPVSHIKLVFTAATETELPGGWIRERGYPVLGVRAVLAGALSGISRRHPDAAVLFLVSGVGPEKSKTAAEIVLDHLHPQAVVNIGTCGVNLGGSHGTAAGEIIFPKCTIGPSGKKLKCLKYPPFPVPEDLKIREADAVQSLTAPLLQRDSCHAAFVDMEAWFQHELFARHGIRFCTIKVAADFCSGRTPLVYKKNLPLAAGRIRDILSFLEQGKSDPKISVVIPAFNRAWSIKRAVDSVLNQSLPAHEIIVVDDGSTDETGKILQDYRDRIILVSHEKNQGVSAARNQGTRASTGEWTAFLDSDDEWKKDKLLHHVEFLKREPFLEIFQCDEIWIRDGKRVNKRKYHEKKAGWIWDISRERCMISPSCVMVKRMLFERHGHFDAAMAACEDYDLWLRISRHHLVGLDPHLDVIRYGGHEDQLSTRYPAMDRFRVYALVKALEAEDEDFFAARLEQAALGRLSILEGGALKRGNLEDAVIYREMAEAVKRGKARCRDFLFLLRR